jgi:hypothetical protein
MVALGSIFFAVFIVLASTGAEEFIGEPVDAGC